MMISHGFQPGRVLADGQYHRFDTEKRGKRNGYYNLSPDGFGVFGDWKSGQQFKFRENKTETMTEEEKREVSARLREAQRKRNEELANKQAQSALKAVQIMNESPAATSDHPYIVRKKISPHMARVLPDNRLVIPIYENDKLVNVQFIAPDGEKRFLTGGKKSGCFLVIPGSHKCVFVVEGFATGATVAEATDCEVVVACDSGNLEKIAPQLRKIYGDAATICFAADNDHKNKTNIGVEKATRAAQKISALVKYPEGIEGTDWNDAAAERGLEYVASCLRPSSPVAVTDDAPLPEITTYTPDTDYELDQHGTPKCTKENLAKLCESNGIKLRYNIIAKRQEILVPDSAYSLDNAEEAAFAHVLSECKREGLSTAHVREFLTNLCDRAQFNPVATWIESKPWDGTDRLASFYSTITQEGEADNLDILNLKETKIKRWMISAVAAAFSPNGISAHGVLVLQGKQYLGKTQWFKKLVPSHLEVIKDGYILRIDDKDSLFQCLANWVVELGELDATFKKSDIAQLKAFLTSDRDIMRLPYAAKKSTFPRRTIFFGSVNEKCFLHDETGNRRFWIIPCDTISFDHALDMQQVWAQFLTMWQSGEKHVMSQDEIEQINEENRDFESIDAIFERVTQYFDWDNYNPLSCGLFDSNWKTATEIARSLGILNPTNIESKRVSSAVKKLNGGYTKRRSGGASSGERSRVLLVPAVHTV